MMTEDQAKQCVRLLLLYIKATGSTSVVRKRAREIVHDLSRRFDFDPEQLPK